MEVESAIIGQCVLPIMLALWLMLLVTYYAFYYAGIIGLGLAVYESDYGTTMYVAMWV